MKHFFTDRKLSTCENLFAICGFGKNGHFVMNLGYLRNKDMVFWEKTLQLEI